jgi:hypothetical protein
MAGSDVFVWQLSSVSSVRGAHVFMRSLAGGALRGVFIHGKLCVHGIPA